MRAYGFRDLYSQKSPLWFPLDLSVGYISPILCIRRPFRVTRLANARRSRYGVGISTTVRGREGAMTKTRENTMADGRENAMAEEKKGNVEAEMRDSIWSVPFVVLMAVNFFQSMAAFMAKCHAAGVRGLAGGDGFHGGRRRELVHVVGAARAPLRRPCLRQLLAQAAPAYRPGHHLPFVFRLRVRRFAGRAHRHPALPRRGHRVQRAFWRCRSCPSACR